MTATDMNVRSVIKERILEHPPEKVWRALTQEHLIREWLMACDFEPQVGHGFALNAPWGTITCEVLEIEPHKTLSYSWQAQGLESVVTWTLTKAGSGTHLRMVQTGFGPDQEQAYRGATAGWTRFLDKLEQVVSNLR
ncbi:SRPBCC family protein [Roseinatronobacter alkalisoli]|uniref:SRPBCC domain-containing protein n=1 Tax=Roseinatronobacter alkalisoli TaxID=3028235 RepID=A0ABT5T6Q9_9RHOB|nr:SRPBCC domain-containing protein [Roseinatronobacter sp. HJB301]MDD7970814.1 SRPBCC domain-containing protein [Roseinatronobacter sp. HJB301]